MIISRTPFRVSYFGGGTDYPAWYLENGGMVLATTINKYCYLTVRYLPPFFEHRYRIVYSKSEQCQYAHEIKHPAVRACVMHLGFDDRGLEIHHDGDLPARSGLGSSSSFVVGLLQVLYALKGQMRGKHELALESIYIEQELLKENVGAQDQTCAAYGGLNIITFLQSGEITVRPVILPSERVEELQQHSMLFFTGIQRNSTDIAASYTPDIKTKNRQLSAYVPMVLEATKVLASSGSLEPFGRLLHEAWLLKRSLSPQVSQAAIDEIYQAALDAGAWGGKIIGAGGGGFILIMAPLETQPAIRERLSPLLEVPVDFENHGSQIVFYEPEQHSGGRQRR